MQMRSHSFFRFISFLFQLTAITWLGLGCQVPKTHQDDADSQRSVLVTVLADMIVNEDRDGKIVRFVDVSPEILQELRARCGERYTIYPVELAELKPLDPSQSPSDFQEKIVVMKNTKREGVIIDTKVRKCERSRAEVAASYDHGSSGVGFLYKLAFARGAWHIVSITTTIAS